MVALILLLNASGLALEWPGLMVLGMSSLRLRIFLHSSTISGDAAVGGPEDPSFQLGPGLSGGLVRERPGEFLELP